MSIDPRRYAAPAKLLSDRTILITGATGALGRALALACAALGATLILHGRRQAPLDLLYDEILARGGPKPATAALDLATATAADYDRLAASIEQEFGRLEGLVHAAALLGDRTPVDQYDVPLWCRVMHVNATAPFILTQVLLPLLRRSTDASIVTVSSGVAQRPRAYWGAYAVSKAALRGFSDLLASELEGNARLRVNGVNPGKMRSPMRAAAYPAEDPNSLAAPAELLATFLYLLGPDSRGVSGQHFDCQ
jgi:NAD(P)-dependent dehydrogenase (short-subunit alcohol dehydrogenase family)